MKERLKNLRTSLGLSQQEFGERMGISRVSVSRFEGGYVDLTSRNVQIVCEKFNVRREWLVDGVGDMFAEDADASINDLRLRYGLSEFETQILQNYLALGARQREMVQELLQTVVVPAAQGAAVGVHPEDPNAPPGDGLEDLDVEELEALYKKNCEPASETAAEALPTLGAGADTG